MVDGPVNPDLGKLLGWINIKLSLIFMRGELSFCFLTNKQNQSEGGGAYLLLNSLLGRPHLSHLLPVLTRESPHCVVSL